ncbi:hypothetical protein N7451_009817 [Penicillium sp. IBT 35674x]|nr:hypothetical protein N7451_009817 [Penicillium sp. IBT 35674x]
MSEIVYITVEPSIQLHGAPTQPYWIHPHLIDSIDSVKGRQFRVSDHIPKGTCLLVDRPYALIPVVDEPATNVNLICSYPACNRRVALGTVRLSCPNACIDDVAWCGTTCRDLDQVRHAFECTWLKRYSKPIRSKRGEYEFGMLWLIIRLLATRQVELQNLSPINGSKPFPSVSKHGWDGINMLCGSVETWSHDRVRNWSTLAKKYLQSSTILPHGLSTDRILHLICQEEANSFGLYPRETGVFPIPTPFVDRGEQFAAAVYPTAAIANHSCLPNIIHKADDQGRMVFTASRDINKGEECCISYFDLTQYTDLTTRRQHLKNSFRFTCKCERCVSEEPVEKESLWNTIPMMDME